jgi:hypothetical protein
MIFWIKKDFNEIKIIVMKKTLIILLSIGVFSIAGFTQQLSSKEKADDLAKNVFSKTKDKKKEKEGITTEVHIKIQSTPVIKDDLSYYEGNYWYKDLGYKMEIRLDANKNLMVTLSIPGEPGVQLRKVSVNQAYFSGIRINKSGEEELWEGVFIDRNDNGNTEFGLGVKLANPVSQTEGLNIQGIFFKKVSP